MRVTAGFLLLVFLTLQSGPASQPQHAHVNISITVDTKQSSFSVDERFLSISLSPKRVLSGHKESVPWSSSVLQVLAKGLSPAWLRVGGTESDYGTFVKSSQIRSFQEAACPQNLHCSSPSSTTFDNNAAFPNSNPVKFNLTQKDWDSVNEFAIKVDWKVLFGLNVQFRTSTGVWNSTNAADMIRYTIQRGYQTAWALGNEPTRFGHLPNTTAIAPQQLADDFHTLNELLTSLSKMGHFVSGPDISKPNVSGPLRTHTHMQYLESFLDAGSKYGGVVNAITWHQYYVSGKTATLEDFISPSVMDIFLDEISKVHSVTAKYNTPLWLGETASAFAGGAAGLSNTYAAGFLFLDKLGVSAVSNLSVLMKQSLMGANYGLLDSNLNPLPPYWLSLLHKNLVGSKVLAVEDGLQYGRSVRVYAHCTKVDVKPNPLVPIYLKGDITLLVVNLHNSTARLLLQGPLMERDKDIYFLTPDPLDWDLKSKSVALNGQRLNMTGSGKSTEPQVSHPQCTNPDKKSAASIPKKPPRTTSTASAGWKWRSICTNTIPFRTAALEILNISSLLLPLVYCCASSLAAAVWLFPAIGSECAVG